MTKTDGTLWSIGGGWKGQIGDNNKTNYSSPVQIGSGTDWASVGIIGEYSSGAVKTDGTLWVWGENEIGQLGQNNGTYYSSPIQIPGTTWSQVRATGPDGGMATKTDNTLWSWGANQFGETGQNIQGAYPVGYAGISSPTQLPGSWSLDNIDTIGKVGRVVAFKQSTIGNT